MIKKKLILLFCLGTFGLTQSILSQGTWQELQYEEYQGANPKLYQIKNVPATYKLVSIGLDQLTNQLKSSEKGVMLELPNELGENSRFMIRETSNLEPALQQKFPNITSYTGTGIDDPTAVAKISLGTDGFHATIFSGNRPTVYIDPYSKDHKKYIVYGRNSLSNTDREFACKVEENTKAAETRFVQRSNANDGKLRTYRIAIVASGEYSQFHLTRQGVGSGESDATKKAAVLSAMNTTMTRVNGVFEMDLGVRMVIVGNNENIIYLDGATDGDVDNDPSNGISPGINDGNAGSMIGQTQTICDGVIGDANYDIGHIFSIGGDGLAGLGVVCRSGQKGNGVTGIGQPIGDPYDIDYVAHELGHQFGANHTQNNNCQRNNATAVEPGSASTIMGYAGICNPNVIGTGSATGNSDDHFHAVSIGEMWDYVSTTATCAAETNTGNAAPTADAGANYTIPASTPFKLTGVATDANGLQSLTYNWEQIDNEIGAVMPPAGTNAEGPMFRSLPSKSSPTRHFPDLATYASGLPTTWEVLPTVAREMNFAFTVRDNFSGGGNTARDDMKVTVISAAAFTVTAPSSPVTWDTGSTQTITWNVGVTTSNPINCANVNIKLSTDGGATFPITLKANTPNDGTENIVIPDNATSQARIMVEAADNIFYNINPTNFTINSTTPTFLINNTSGDKGVCNSGNQSVDYTLNLDFVNGFSETVTLSASGQPLVSTVNFSPSTINSDGNVTMTVSNLDNATAGSYAIKVTGTSSSLTQEIDVNLQVFEGNFGALTLTSPVNGATDVSLTPELQWDADTNASAYVVEVATDSGFTNVVSSQEVSTNSFTTATLNELATYYWRVKPKNDCGEGSFSSLFSFTTQSCTICNSTGTMEYNTSTTLVQFNTILNATGKTAGYNDYTSIKTNVKRGDSYNLTVNANTDGNFRTQTKVWIDWNGDCLFDTNTEEYDLDFAANVANGPTANSPLSITIPQTAMLGEIVMRVSTKYTNPSSITYPTACEIDFDGEVEDYTLVIEDESASIDDNAFEGFNLYPNPNSGSFTLKFETIDTRKTQLELFDVRGRLVQFRTFTNTNQYFKEEIRFQSLSKGLYLLKITNGNRQTSRKLIIE
ncbi:MAG: hypothetical protein CMB99_02670 [Flavobacteriaceae bacterium]|nr:hypothetical protein [Flavobacteriaceae bacterium]|tara:strand:- start:100829 stop:104164 length:3336 start_codon:yes stop_codon:yes gene_type:complete